MSTSVAQVLVVDDEWTVRQQLSRALTLVGVPCDCASDGEDALDRYLHNRYELIVTDLRMPKCNGHSLAIALLDQPDPPIIVALTGVTEPRLASDLLARGVSDVVYKPINFFNLAERLKLLLESSPVRLSDERPETTVQQDSESQEKARQNQAPPRLTRQDLEQYFGQSPPRHRWLALMLQYIDWDTLPNPSKEMRQTLRQLSRRPSHAQINLRSEGRIIFNELGAALALDEHFEPSGQPFKLIVRDVSRHGIGLFHTKWLTGQHLAVSWRGLVGSRLVVVARALRCRQVGEFFEIGAIIDDSQHSSMM